MKAGGSDCVAALALNSEVLATTTYPTASRATPVMRLGTFYARVNQPYRRNQGPTVGFADSVSRLQT